MPEEPEGVFISEGPPCGGLRDWASHLVLPWLTFALIFAAIYMRVLRSTLLETLEQPYVDAARVRGVPEWRVLVRHALPNAILPVLTMLAMEGGTVLGAAIYIETVFGLPGLGRLAVRAFSGMPGFDLPTITGLVLVFGLVVMFLNTVANVAYAFVHPPVRDARSTRVRRARVGVL